MKPSDRVLSAVLFVSCGVLLVYFLQREDWLSACTMLVMAAFFAVVLGRRPPKS